MRKLLVLLLMIVVSAFGVSTLRSQEPLPDGSSYRGDMDENGSINIFDLLEVLKSLRGNIANERLRQLADANEDGIINIFDVLAVLQIMGGARQPGVISWGPPGISGIDPINVAPGEKVTIMLSGISGGLELADFSVAVDTLVLATTGYSYGRLEVDTPEDYRGGMATVVVDGDTLGSVFVNVLNQNPPAIDGVQLFPEDNPWNQSVEGLPVHEKSETWIKKAGEYGTLHPDFGTNPNYGIPYVLVDSSQPRVPLTFTWPGECDPGPYPIPDDAPIEGGENSTGDRHILVVDTTTLTLYETWSTYPEGEGWRAGSGAIFDLTSNAIRPDGWTSSDAAGLPVLPGLIRYEEIEAGEITHAVRFTVPNSERDYIYPATHYASQHTDGLYFPMGARMRLKADYDISNFTGAARIILEAFKKYGLIMADNGSVWYFQGVSDPRWDVDNLNTLKMVTGSAFEVVDTEPMLVTGKDERLNVRPGGSVTSPVDGDTFSAPAEITLGAEAFDNDGTVALVEFLADGEKLGETTAEPYELTWSDVPAGSYQLAVRVTDNEGKTNTSFHVTVTVE